MKTRQHHLLSNGWKDYPSELNPGNCQLVLVFGASEAITKPRTYDYLRSIYPKADIILSSTAGEILGDTVYDDSAVATAIGFEKTQIKCVETNIKHQSNSFETGRFLLNQLAADDLKAVFVISDGTFINGSELVEGLSNDAHHAIITGALAGDAARFEKTFTGLNAVPSQGNVIAAGFYGNDIIIGHGSLGGWDEFGQERTITRSDKNILFEIDSKNALQLYKEYLGDYVNELPGSALLFPISIGLNGSDKKLVRTILSINEDENSMTFAGNMPEGSKVRLMKADFDKLIEASSDAAGQSFGNQNPDLAILISCVGRKLILQERTDEEVEAAKEILGPDTAVTGFYSYGEISPFNPGSH
ncbi:MAG TPA: FIST N-terminal domain-containing protein, partial [Mucilaginibacter sp.]|nr:FIST N-terminal domain-containing protein [Mucilaginibacter sp.]